MSKETEMQELIEQINTDAQLLREKIQELGDMENIENLPISNYIKLSDALSDFIGDWEA